MVRFLLILMGILVSFSAFPDFNEDVRRIELTIDLGKWVAEDQALRSGFYFLEFKSYSDEEREQYAEKIREVDRRNTENLKVFLKEHGWPLISKFSPYGDFNAFILCQHADQDKAFQKQCLSMMTEALENRDTNPSNFALLTDRVLVGEGKKQRFGSQGTCIGPHQWEPHPIEEPEKVDELRRSMGLQPLEEYKKIMNQYCP